MTVNRFLLAVLVALLLAGCAALTLREPLRATVAGLEPLPGEGLEARFAVKLRIQNPNETPIDFDGVAVDLALNGKHFASGVSDQRGTIPRYGETVITVPVTVPITAVVRQLLGMSRGRPTDKISYHLRGQLGGVGLGGVRFDSHGELLLPLSEGRRQRHETWPGSEPDSTPNLRRVAAASSVNEL
jgi:LEA14-like dessication related protein